MINKDSNALDKRINIENSKEVRKCNPIPNIITTLRIIGTIILIFLDIESIAFFATYAACGISDVLDGIIARATNSTSEFGAKLDSVADLLFYAIMLFKILPILIIILPAWVWGIVLSVIALRIITYIMVAIRFHRFASLHTYLNKITGMFIFLIPVFIRMGVGETYCAIVAVVSAMSTVEEFLIHLIRKEYTTGIQTLIHLK